MALFWGSSQPLLRHLVDSFHRFTKSSEFYTVWWCIWWCMIQTCLRFASTFASLGFGSHLEMYESRNLKQSSLQHFSLHILNYRSWKAPKSASFYSLRRLDIFLPRHCLQGAPNCFEQNDPSRLQNDRSSLPSPNPEPVTVTTKQVARK